MKKLLFLLILLPLIGYPQQKKLEKILTEKSIERDPWFRRNNPDFYITKAEKLWNIDSNSQRANIILGICYYCFFANGHKNGAPKDSLDMYAALSTRHLALVFNQDDEYAEIMKYPLIQLSNYQGDTQALARYEKYDKQHYHFPLAVFANLSEGWQTNLAENVLWDSHRVPNIGKGAERITFLKKEEQETLSLQEWYDFAAVIDSCDFWNLPTNSDFLRKDGSQWILEGAEPGRYHVVDRWDGQEIERYVVNYWSLRI